MIQTREAHRAMLDDRLAILTFGRRAAFAAAALTRAASFHRRTLPATDRCRATLDAALDALWRSAETEWHVEISMIAEIAEFVTGEDDDPRFPHDNEYLHAFDSLLVFLIDRQPEALRDACTWLMDLWDQEAYDQEGLAEYTRANDARVWLAPVLRQECERQLLDLSILSSSELTPATLQTLRARADSDSFTVFS